MYEEGIYHAKAASWGFAETVNGNSQFWMTFEVLGRADEQGPAAPAAPQPGGPRTWSITLTSDKNAEWLVSVVQHLGFDGDDLLALDPDRPAAFNFQGAEFLAQCRHREYDGRTRENWSVYRTPARTKPSTDRLEDLNNRFGKKVQELKDRRLAAAKGDKTRGKRRVS